MLEATTSSATYWRVGRRRSWHSWMHSGGRTARDPHNTPKLCVQQTRDRYIPLLAAPFSPDPPGETIALLRAEGVIAVSGNNDRYLIDWGTPRWPHTLWMRLRRSDPPGDWLESIGEGQARLAPDELAWLRGLPEELLLTDGVWLCHGMPGNPRNSIWPRSPDYDTNVSDADRDASLQMLRDSDIQLALCGHVPEPHEYHDTLPDGRPLHVVRAGPRTAESVSYAVLTRMTNGWTAEWHTASIP
jgi:hypothetical protein